MLVLKCHVMTSFKNNFPSDTPKVGGSGYTIYLVYSSVCLSIRNKFQSHFLKQL